MCKKQIVFNRWFLIKKILSENADKISVININTFQKEKEYIMPKFFRNYTCSVLDDSKIYIFGRNINEMNERDLYCFDTISEEWTKLKSYIGNGFLCNASCIFNNNMYFYSRTLGKLYVDDFYFYDFTLNEWEKIETFGEKPKNANYRYLVELNGYLYLYGDSCVNFVSVAVELWRIKVRLNHLKKLIKFVIEKRDLNIYFHYQ